LAGKEVMPLTWFVAGFSGIVVLGPFLLSWFSVSGSKLKFNQLELVSLILLAVGGVNLLNWDVLVDIRGLWLIVYTFFLLWSAFRFPPVLATTFNLFLVGLFTLMPPDISDKGFDIAPQPIRVLNVPILMTTYLIISLVILVVNGDRQPLTEGLRVLNQKLEKRVLQQAEELDEAQAELAKVALSITEAIPVGTYTMVLPAGEGMAYFSFMSEQFLQICGLDREEASANPFNAFACVHPEDYDAWVALNAEAFAKKRPFFGETRLLVNGELRWVRAESIPRDLPDGLMVWEGVITDITQTKLYEAELKEAQAELEAVNENLENRVKQRTVELEQSRAEFQRLVDDIGDQFLVFSHTPEGIFNYVSSGVETVFGLKSEDVLGKNWTDIVNWLPESLKLGNRLDQEVLEGKATNLTVEMSFIRSDGEQRSLKITEHAVRDQTGQIFALEGVVEDITERKKFITALAASEAKYRTFIETANDLIFSIDCDSCFTYLSPNIIEILGYSPEELKGLAYADIVHPDDLTQCNIAFQRLMGGQRVKGLEYRVRRKDGSWRWHSSSLTPEFNSQGQVVGLFGFALDYTERKLAELRQQKLNQELLKANQLKDEFLAMMSHELRTPLNAILGMTESLEEEIFGPISDRQKNSLEVIYKSGSHLLDLINDILDLSKMESGQMELSWKTAKIQELVESTLIYVKTQTNKKQIALTKEIAEDLPAVTVDERRIRQVLINLLNNAVKFTPEGGKVTVSAALLPSFADIDRPHIRLAVRDTGIGISTEDLPRLFKPFIQIDSALNRKHEGTGLGLSLVKNIVEMHGGEVGVESEVGRGSCFWFTIPCGANPLADNSQ
ncbi:PAS domain S-box protein, partial [Synechocystis salina LEGE 06155]|nr:PAS domain S-box protein [Synechocystis salina LEGE 06155]